MRPTVYAHRGASAAYPEHTRAAYVQALLDGADGVECDVHLTRDGHLVLHHDARLGRTSDGRGAVSAHTLAQLRRLDWTSWKGVPLPPTHGAADRQLLTLPELIDLLHDAGRPVGLAVETKHPSPYGHRLEDEVLALLLREGWDPGTGLLGRLRISLMSFHPGAVRRLLESVPARHVCQLAGTTTRRTVGESLRVGPAAAAVLHAGMRLVVPPALPVIGAGLVEIAGPGIGLVRERTDLVRRWAARGCVLRVWTVDDRRDVELCLALGVQELTTNRPADVLRWVGAARAAAPREDAASMSP
ncbi:glycerophosphodiester phosphodiesterase [Kocuria sp. LUK]|uniref:Glycerophosphodiester phosphodiesterase n=1 Tax=Kocuria flava TaxID=446860 RepID=A0A2N4T1E8_9MICC|nr:MULTISPECIES: glycerophosphodiester phosphodiesterase family protein [Kocuria]MCD1145516.1 glycerophosphodiester phosphodiesterase [Kocuria sp. LUK]PLC12052.1 glycerophosphodiester phosphodiesterase [Kocuria flava]